MLPLELLRPEPSDPHDSSLPHVKGQSEFIDDRPFLKNELLVGIVYSSHAHAKILSIETDAALAISGVTCVLTYKDLQHNAWGAIFPDQPFLAVHEVNYVGEVLCVLGAENSEALRLGLKAIKVDYEILPAILSIRAAQEAESFIGSARLIERGRVETAFQGAP
ncbi:MAG: xanthine dehydrogenase molybdopterin binding subunit, partial [Proteobacteria bacterium]|nr:xanthine dehydrogenase molybdopterin binding subunit [Pseudomonadota bacterium]